MNYNVDKSRFDPGVVQELGRIDLIAEVIASAVQQGLRRAHKHGFTSEFSDFKPYALGDDLRFLDWRLYARTDRLYVKRFEAETNLETMLLLDASRSMAWRWGNAISKLEYAANLLAAMAAVSMRQRDQVGFLVNDAHQLHYLPPRCRRAQLTEVFATLERVEPGASGTFARLVASLAGMKRHRGFIVLCSDLEEDEQEIGKAMEMLSGTEDEVILFHILDRAEEILPFDRATHIEDSETTQRLQVNLASLKRHHAEEVRTFRGKWRDLCLARGIGYQPIHTGMNYLDVFINLLEEEG